jgi:hypothetical protein
MLSNIINFIHLILVLVIISAPFIDNNIIKKYVFTFLIYLLFQYLSGYEKCGLTELEYLVMGEKYQHGFLYRIINPLIKIPEEYFDKYLFFVHLIYIIILYNQLNKPTLS